MEAELEMTKLRSLAGRRRLASPRSGVFSSTTSSVTPSNPRPPLIWRTVRQNKVFVPTFRLAFLGEVNGPWSFQRKDGKTHPVSGALKVNNASKHPNGDFASLHWYMEALVFRWAGGGVVCAGVGKGGYE
jgi:hypothetical protein